MIVSRHQLDIALAKRGHNLSDLVSAGFSRSTLSRIGNGGQVRPATVGKLAKALGVEVEELVRGGDEY